VNRYRTGGEIRPLGDLTAFRLDAQNNRWCLVVHPLWDLERPEGILADAIQVLGGTALFTDTFELARRQVNERENLLAQWRA